MPGFRSYVVFCFFSFITYLSIQLSAYDVGVRHIIAESLGLMTILSFNGINFKRSLSFARRIAEQNRHLRLFQFSLERVSDYCVWLNEKGQVLSSNRSFRGAFNPYERTLAFRDVDSQYSDPAWQKQFTQLKKDGTALFRKRLRSSRGEIIPVEISANYVLYQAQDLCCFFMRDLRESLEMEQFVEEQKAKMAKASKMSALGEMAAGIAHEINNPLSVITARTGILRKILDAPESLPGETPAKSLDIIDRTVQRIVHIVRGLRSFARSSEADAFEPTDIHDIIEDTLQYCWQRLNARAVRLDYERGAPLWVACRPIQISQVILNLLNNAVDAIDNREEKWIRLQVEIEGPAVVLRVIDCGAGLSADHENKVMQPFFTTKPAGQGVGLGLSISRSIVEQHRGQLTYELRDGHTCFTLSLQVDANGESGADQAS
jgi:signal transduction histidine kinase